MSTEILENYKVKELMNFLFYLKPFVFVFSHQAQIQLDCGEDNICVPDLKLAVIGWEHCVGHNFPF